MPFAEKDIKTLINQHYFTKSRQDNEQNVGSGIRQVEEDHQ
jgi:hypothetical protein